MAVDLKTVFTVDDFDELAEDVLKDMLAGQSQFLK
eukprot:CAMPEP_0172820420 /NCGR_PEP_ID=MMETSP1075-20121228/15259_1 /TAXON_ID=2916 /ORGANISM="Ceratium fusus, Strain PA161109" /LENGTH=34 /DNA_ID= /DNA_START= /DNA_END= /DNA_ORIENTATION=